MKKFEEQLKQKAHLTKIKQAKKTIASSSLKPGSRMSSSKIGTQAQILLKLFDNKSYGSIPAYRLLKTSGLQQYARDFIIRGYGVNLGKLALISSDEKEKLYEEIKVLPGHTVKLDKIIDTLAKTSYEAQIPLEQGSVKSINEYSDKKNYKMFNQRDYQYEKQLERVLNQYTPQSQQKKRTSYNTKYSEKKPSTSNATYDSKYAKTKYIPTGKQKNADFKKKQVFQISNKPTVRKSIIPKEQNKKQFLSKFLKNMSNESTMPTRKVMQINLEIDKFKVLNRSFDGALMSSTIANIDIQQLIYAFSGLVVSKIIVAEPPKLNYQKEYTEMNSSSNIDDIQDEVGQILRQSYLHPLYKEQVDEEIEADQALSEGENEEEEQVQKDTTAEQQKDKMMESSFLGGAESVQFGLSEPLKIFEEPQPSEIDYFKPTIDSVFNFIKNVVLAAKMQRQIPIMAGAYLQNFLSVTKLKLTSLNYKRLLVTVLLISSKIWDDQSFETPSFSRTFPQYSTVLMNEMQKQVVKYLDYKLKIDKKQYTKIYFTLRKFIKQNVKSYQNRKITLKRIRQLQAGIKVQYKTNYLTKRNSF